MLAQDCILLKPNMILPGALARPWRVDSTATASDGCYQWPSLYDSAPALGTAWMQLKPRAEQPAAS